MLNKMQFEQFLQPQMILPIRIIHLGMSGGVVFFWIAIFIIRQVIGDVPPNTDPGIFKIFFFIWILLALTIGLAGFLFYSHPLGNMLTKSTGSSLSGEENDEHYAKLINVFRTLTIIRLGLMEGTIFFGLVVLLISVLWGLMEANIYTQLTGFGAAIFTILLFSLYPTKAKVLDECERIVEKVRDNQ